ncbi:MAG: S41 family peptidase [Sedimentisphaerales bacterium]|nr:S41 family peptidase [Sedimentisphaerales bacterium]
MRKEKQKIHDSMYLACLVAIVVSFAACALTSRPAPADINEVLLENLVPLSGEDKIVNDASELICQGDFTSALELIEEKIGSEPNELDSQSRELLQAVKDYEVISRQRKEFRDKAYSDKVAKLDEFREMAETNDPNEPNDITVILSAIAQITELATQEQKEELLAQPYVKQVIQEAIDKAAGYEVEGEWIDAYSNCYLWLPSIDPNNEVYKKYAEEIYEKALIAASLEDSPCETRKERYEGVEKEIFMRAIIYLNQNYVSPLDYDLMTEKAIEQCRLVGEVMEFPPEDYKKTLDPNRSSDEYKTSLSAWSQALNTLHDEAKQSSDGIGLEDFLELFMRVLLLNQATVNIPEPFLVSQFSDATLSALDPHTVIIWPKQVEDFDKQMTNEFFGIGVEISKPAGSLTVASLLANTPASKSGLDAGDIIEKIDGVETKDMPINCAVDKITGPRGTKVTLTIKRIGEEKTLDIVITRDKIVVPTIRGWQRNEAGQWDFIVDKEEKIGYIRLTSFSAESSDDLEQAMDELESQGIEGLILDLRYNSGGLLTTAIDVCNKFISEGLIVSRVPRPGKLTVFEEARKKGTHPDYPLVILVNSSSASASEIVAGALSDKAQERATLVGSRTHGKGSVQGITSISGSRAQLKYTMAHYHLPSGQRVESRDAMTKLGRKDWGVAPDVQVDLISDEIRKMSEVQRDNDVLFQEAHEMTDESVKKHTIEETLTADRQLAVGILVLKSKLVQDEVIAKANVSKN